MSQRRSSRAVTPRILPNQATDDVLLEAIGNETESDCSDVDPNDINDGEYSISEDYNEAVDPTRTNTRTTGTPFIDNNEILDLTSHLNAMVKPQLNLPESFPDNPKPLHFFSLIYSHQMINAVRRAMNLKYKHLLEESNILNDNHDDDGFLDPLNPTMTSTSEPSSHLQVTTVEIVKFVTPDVYKFFGCQILFGLGSLRNEEAYFYGDRIFPPVVSQLSYPVYKKMKRFFTIPAFPIKVILTPAESISV